MRRYRKRKMSLRKAFKRHRHYVGSMKGLSSIPVRFRGRRI